MKLIQIALVFSLIALSKAQNQQEITIIQEKEMKVDDDTYYFQDVSESEFTGYTSKPITKIPQSKSFQETVVILTYFFLNYIIFPILAAFYLSLLWGQVLAIFDSTIRKPYQEEEDMKKRRKIVDEMNMEEARVDGDEGEICPICLDVLDDEVQNRKLSCKHIFHRECIDKWLITKKMSCPTCKRDASPVQVKIPLKLSD